METLLPTQPENYGHLLKRSFHLYRSSFLRIILPALLLSIILFMPQFCPNMILRTTELGGSALVMQTVYQIILNLAALYLFIAILWRMHCVIINKHEPLLEDVSMGFKKLFSVFIAAIFQSIIVLTLAIMVYGIQMLLYQYNLLLSNNWFSIILTIVVFAGQLAVLFYVSALFIFMTPIIVIENKGVISAIERSVALVWNHWLRTITFQLSPWVYYFLCLFLIKFIFRINIHFSLLDQTPYTFWASL